MPRIALISTPWPLFERPSIQLGALKAFLTREQPGIQVDARHLYLSTAAELGYDLYAPISERTWLSESPYGALLYPERLEEISRFWRRRSRGIPSLQACDFPELTRRLEASSLRLLEETPWEAYDLLGCSVCFGQLTSALYFIRQIRKRTSLPKVVIGGSACAGRLGSSLLEAFPEIDFLISGEGELPLLHLAKWLRGSGDPEEPPPFPGLRVRGREAPTDTDAFSQVPRMDDLPLPDYDDYFRLLDTLEPGRRFFPRLPFEGSRGCWWNRSRKGITDKGCAFCNLNIQWSGYRARSADQILRGIDALVKRYRVLSVSFTDNLLPAGDLDDLFLRIGGLGRDLRLFGEIRATTTRKELIAMGRGGMEEVQVGIEALSTGLLRRLNKGTTAIQNLEIMKNCEAPGLPRIAGNLILGFPGSEPGDVRESLENLEFAVPFRPLKSVSFWLGYGSPVWRDPTRFGIRGIRNHPFFAHLFPPEVLRRLVLLIQGYRGGLRHQQRLWRPVREKVQEWDRAYRCLRRSPGSPPILSYGDGGDFLLIRQRRHRAEDMTHRLIGPSREIYLFCEENRGLSEILARFPEKGEGEILPFLRTMVDKRLIFTEADRYLSLAVPERGWG
ncbi:MAG: RiPP maturation radical SAM C-methyltransferase [Deltaproteobacteria bacterium]|nr:RiPP maturation radical SAM C-methyltransferase [Deltaproteobacteria bacterium]